MKTLLSKITPPFFKEYMVRQYEAYRANHEFLPPKYELTSKHLANLRVVENRRKLLTLLPPNGTAAEIGVNKGDFSEDILRMSSPSKLHLIDVWSSERYHKGLENIVRGKFAEEIKKGTVEINVGLSVEISDKFDDEYFDWIYIDTNHSYLTTKNELELYSKKMKPNGIIAGHDFIVGNWKKSIRYGVIEAVHEFCVKNEWELLFLTVELAIPPSFAIRKIPV